MNEKEIKEIMEKIVNEEIDFWVLYRIELDKHEEERRIAIGIYTTKKRAEMTIDCLIEENAIRYEVEECEMNTIF